MTDRTRPPGDHTPTAPDARGESALGTGRGTTAPGTDADRAATPGTGTPGIGTPGRETAHGDSPGTGTPGTDPAHGDTLATGTPGRRTPHGDSHGTGTPGTDAAHGDSHRTGTPGTDAAHGTGTPGGETPGARDRLVPHDHSDKLGARLQHAVAGFVDGPRAAVEEADQVLEEIAARFTEAVTERRRTLRRSWQSVEGGEGGPVSSADTEQLRLALKDYREFAERLLHV
ncbi:hypothetical protein ACIPM2_22345 [Streptomyces sp. NPDC086081]|uniref:hypothetical protein n=1 Tax=Streptomyces sp. NPDC086081 TaxID=3365749 RepID=UPI0037FB23D8